MPPTPDDILDQLLVLQAQDGQRDALDALVRRWEPRLLRHARRLTGDPNAAADVAQETWLAIARGLRRLHDPALFRGWAYQIATNKAADWVRRRSRDRKLEKRMETREPAAVASDFERGGNAEKAERITRLRDAIRTLSPEHRVVIDMYYGESMSITAIAHALDLPTGTVKSRLHHARLSLKRCGEREGTEHERKQP